MQGDKHNGTGSRCYVYAALGVNTTKRLPGWRSDIKRLPHVRPCAGCRCRHTSIGSGTLTETTLDPKLRELVILRVSQRCKGRYAWVQHAAIAKTVDVSDAQIAALERSEIPLDLFNVRERVTFAFADEVVDRAFATEDTFAAMRRMFSPCELLELLLLVGYFRMICGVMTTMAVEVESPFGGKVLDLVRKTAGGKEAPRRPSAGKPVGVPLAMIESDSAPRITR